MEQRKDVKSFMCYGYNSLRNTSMIIIGTYEGAGSTEMVATPDAGWGL